MRTLLTALVALNVAYAVTAKAGTETGYRKPFPAFQASAEMPASFVNGKAYVDLVSVEERPIETEKVEVPCTGDGAPTGCSEIRWTQTTQAIEVRIIYPRAQIGSDDSSKGDVTLYLNPEEVGPKLRAALNSRRGIAGSRKIEGELLNLNQPRYIKDTFSYDSRNSTWCESFSDCEPVSVYVPSKTEYVKFSVDTL